MDDGRLVASRPATALVRLARAFVVGLLTVATGALAEEAPDRPRDLNEPVVLAVSPNSYPYSFRGENGQLTGFIHEVSEAVAQAVNLKTRRLPLRSNEMADALRSGRADVIQWWGETAERRSWAEFSVPIIRFETVAVVRRDDPRIRTLGDLRGKRVTCGQVGNVGWNYLRTEQPEAIPVLTATSQENLTLVAAGAADATVMSRLTAISIIDQLGLKSLVVLPDRIKGDAYDVRYCFTVRKGDSLLLARLNEGLAILHRTGEFDAIYRKWFGRYESRTFSRFELVSYVAAALAFGCIAATWGWLRQRTLRRRIARQAAELAEQRSLLAALYEKHPLATVVLEVPAAGPPLLVAANPEAARLLHLDPARPPLAPLPSLGLLPELQTLLADSVARWSRSGGKAERWEVALAGGQQLLESTIVPLDVVGSGAHRFCLLVGDVTKRRLLDQEIAQSRRLRALGELVGGIAHEFNNLLTPVIVTTSLARHDLTLAPAVQADFGVIEGAARRAAELTRRLLTFGRKSNDHAQPVLLSDAVENCFALLRPTGDRRIEWSLRDPGNLPPLQFNSTDLNQVVFNLVINARDTLLEKLGQSHPEGWIPRLTVTLEETTGLHPPPRTAPGGPPPLAWQQLTVADNGNGIAPELVDRIFEPFFTTKEVGQGTGLGLATVWHVVTEAGGDILVDSTPGEGCAFRVRLPRRATGVMAAAASGDLPPPATTPHSGRPLRILLAEDEPLVARTTAAVLAHHGHTVTHQADGADAWQQLASATDAFDLLLLDINMPRMSGIDLVRRVRATTYAGAIVVMTGRLSDGDRRTLQELGVDRLLNKPFSLPELTDALRTVRPKANA